MSQPKGASSSSSASNTTKKVTIKLRHNWTIPNYDANYHTDLEPNNPESYVESAPFGSRHDPHGHQFAIRFYTLSGVEEGQTKKVPRVGLGYRRSSSSSSSSKLSSSAGKEFTVRYKMDARLWGYKLSEAITHTNSKYGDLKVTFKDDDDDSDDAKKKKSNNQEEKCEWNWPYLAWIKSPSVERTAKLRSPRLWRLAKAMDQVTAHYTLIYEIEIDDDECKDKKNEKVKSGIKKLVRFFKTLFK